jgi:hypothetical protein
MKKIVETKKSPGPSTKKIPEKVNVKDSNKKKPYHFTNINAD